MAVKCRVAYTRLRLFYPFRYIFSYSQKFLILNYLLFLYLITLMSYVSALNQICKSAKILVSVSPIVVNTTILHIIRDLACLKFGNVLFSTYALVFSLLRSNTPLYLHCVLQLNNIPLITRLFILPHISIH